MCENTFQTTFFIAGCNSIFIFPLFSTSVFIDAPQQEHFITTPSQHPITSISFSPHKGQDTLIFLLIKSPSLIFGTVIFVNFLAQL